MQKISILMAMQSEAEPVIEALELSPRQHPFPPPIPFELFQRKNESGEINLLISGRDARHNVDNVATIPATLMAYLAIEHFKPTIVINAGTAGGVEAAGCAIGDVYLGSGQFTFHDRRIPIPGFREYGRGNYSDYDTQHIANDLGLKTGPVSSGNSLDMLDEDFREIQESGAIIKDMEAAAIAWVCQTFATPLIAIKAITDLIDHPAPTEQQFLANLQHAVTELGRKVPVVVHYLLNNNVRSK